MTKIILASASPRRAELLRQIGLDFEVQVSGVSEEGVVDKDPAKLVEKLAIAKALAVAKNQPRREAVVIAADTVVCVDGTLLAKKKIQSRECCVCSRAQPPGADRHCRGCFAGNEVLSQWKN